MVPRLRLRLAVVSGGTAVAMAEALKTNWGLEEPPVFSMNVLRSTTAAALELATTWTLLWDWAVSVDEATVAT